MHFDEVNHQFTPGCLHNLELLVGNLLPVVTCMSKDFYFSLLAQ